MKLGTKFIDAMSAAIKGTSLVILLGSRLFLAAAGLAQSGAAPSQAVKPVASQPAMLNPGQNLPDTKDPQSKAVTSATPAKGAHEGIQVHGYWTIEVRNPDGTISTHREFENAVQLTGQNYLESLLEGYTSPGGLVIALNGATIQWLFSLRYFLGGNAYLAPVPTFTEAGPCLPYQNNLQSLLSQSSGGPASGTTCLIVDSPTSTTASWLSSLCLGVPSTSCSANLSVTGAQSYFDSALYGAAAPAATAPLTLSGSITVAGGALSGTINDVETLFTTCPSTPGVGWDSCRNYWNPSISTYSGVIGSPVTPSSAVVSVFTEKDLDGLNGDTQPVPYQPGQTIAVTVQISFQ